MLFRNLEYSSLSSKQTDDNDFDMNDNDNDHDNQIIQSNENQSNFNFQAAISNPLDINSSMFIKLSRFLSDCLVHRYNECSHSLSSFMYSVKLLGSTLGSMCHLLLHKKPINDSDLVHCIRSFSRLLEDIGSKSQSTRFYVPSLIVDIICMFFISIF